MRPMADSGSPAKRLRVNSAKQSPPRKGECFVADTFASLSAWFILSLACPEPRRRVEGLLAMTESDGFSDTL